MDAIASRLGEGAVGDLVHSYCARCGAVYVERLGVEGQAPGPAPVSEHHRIAGTLDLPERRQQFGGYHVGGIFSKEGSVLAPCLGRRLVQRAAHRKEKLRWFRSEEHTSEL